MGQSFKFRLHELRYQDGNQYPSLIVWCARQHVLLMPSILFAKVPQTTAVYWVLVCSSARSTSVGFLIHTLPTGRDCHSSWFSRRRNWASVKLGDSLRVNSQEYEPSSIRMGIIAADNIPLLCLNEKSSWWWVIYSASMTHSWDSTRNGPTSHLNGPYIERLTSAV